MFADFHLHTTYSDGKLSVKDTLGIAKDKNIEMLSITDHDTIDGVDESIKLARLLNVKCISGMELSCRNDDISVNFPQDVSIHILAYNIDYKKIELQKYLNQYHKKRKMILLELIDDLSKSGFDVKYEDIIVIAGSQMRIQDIINHIYSSFCTESYKQVLVEIANSYYTKLFELDIALSSSITFIKSLGGIPVLAHAFFSYKDYDVINNGEKEVITLINYLYELGIEGLEVFYPKYNRAQTELLLSLAKKNHLLVTAGSDFHGTSLRNTMMNCEITQLQETIKLLESINRYK